MNTGTAGFGDIGEGLFFFSLFFITSGLVSSDEISVSKCLIIICKC